MKKIIKIFILLITFALLVSCQTKQAEVTVEAEKKDINVVALKGPTSMGLAKLMEDSKSGDLLANYHFDILSRPDEAVVKLVKEEAMFATIPSNMASVLYHKMEGNLQVLAINTLGVLYLVEHGKNTMSLEDLAGKTIYASGKNAAPEYVLNYILAKHDLLDKVTIEWKAEHAEALNAILNDENSLAMLPQPFVTVAQSKNDQINIAIDMNKEWEAIQSQEENPSALVMGVLVGNKKFVAENPEIVNQFLDQYKASVAFVNSDVEAASQLIGNFDIVPAAVAKVAIPYCNITFIEGSEMQGKLKGYLDVLWQADPKSVGGNLPADEFYFKR